jgi:endonuclease/exonuclease/phosphatase family metal-dependent hydrolase
MSGNCEPGRGLRRHEKNATEAGAGRFEKPAPAALAAPPEGHESLIGRKTVEEEPLTGLSFGDLNAVPGSEPLTTLLASWRSTTAEPQVSFPAGQPTRQIDFILYRAAGVLEPGEVRVLDEPVASDHRPILAEFRVR